MNPTPLLDCQASRAPRTRTALALTGALLLTTTAAMAQAPKKDEPLKPPTPPSVSTSWSPILSVLVGVGLSGLVLGAAFIPSKRGHQD
jgi:hypothetical protein